MHEYPLSFDAPGLAGMDWLALALSVAAAMAIFRLKVGMLRRAGAASLACCCGWAAHQGPRHDFTGAGGPTMRMKRGEQRSWRHRYRRVHPIVGPCAERRLAEGRRDAGPKPAVSDDVHRYGFPRTDLAVTLDGVTIRPTLALGGWVAFKPVHGGAMVMGDLVLLETEINPVMAKMIANGLEITAVHNHLLRAARRRSTCMSAVTAIR